MFSEYVQHGFKLCRIDPGTKGPRGAAAKGWNDEEKAITDPTVAGQLVGAGLCHSYSGTCALDVDRFDEAAAFLAAEGIDLHSLFNQSDAVQIVSGQPNRGKLIYAMPRPLPSKSFAEGAFELRCGTANGKTAQDVLPPSVHPSGTAYRWVGDWKKLPPIPESLLAFWRNSGEVSSVHVREPFTQRENSAKLNEIRDLLSRRDPNCSYADWISIGMAINETLGGSEDGLALWDNFSAPGDTYPGMDSLRSHWLSFGRSSNPVTLDSLRKADRASADQFTDVTADWFDSPEPVSADASPGFRFLSLSELFDRPEPTWMVPGILPDSGLGCLYGQPGGGKTFLAVDIMLDIALGLPWRGIPVQQGSGLYIAAEDDRGVQMRFASGLAARGVKDAPVRVLPASPVFTSPEQQTALLASIKPLGRQSLVFIDTLAAVTPGSDENAAKDMSQLIHFCQKIHKLTGGLVLLVHHEGKSTGKGPRGWSGLHGAFDVEWEITDQETHREMRISKMKNAQTGNSYSFQLTPAAGSCVVEWL